MPEEKIYIKLLRILFNFLQSEVIGLGDDDSITLSKDTAYCIVIAVLACLLVISISTAGFGLVKTAAPQNATQPAQPNATQPAAPAAPTSVKTMELPPSLGMMPVMGPANSPITLLEFSDFQCTFCGFAFGAPWTPAYANSQYAPMIGTIPKFEADYVNTGKADFIDFPVAFLDANDGTNESRDSADAALCANAQGMYFQMYNAIFGAQDSNEGDGKYTKPKLEIIAQNVSGLNQSEFDACLNADTYVNQTEELTDEWGTVYNANICQYHPGTATQPCGPGTPTIWILVNASQTTQSKVSAAAAAADFDWGLTSDNSTYVIIASPFYVQLQAVMSALE